jgi:hypothetical protein
VRARPRTARLRRSCAPRDRDRRRRARVHGADRGISRGRDRA